MTTMDVSEIAGKALSQARDCILEPQATEAGFLFGSDLLRNEFDPKRRNEIQVLLIDALSKTTPGSNARAFMNELLVTVSTVWGDEL